MKNFFMTRTLSLASLLLLLVGTGCVEGFLDIPPPPWEQQGDDDDDDDDDAVDLGVMLSGTVVATARATGEVMSDWAYLICAGKTVLYVTLDPSDLSDPAAKFTMDTPGEWELHVQRDTGPYYLVALTDDGNRIIGTEDVHREYAFNPVHADRDQSGLEIVMDLPCNADGSDAGGPGGWGGNGGGGWGGGGGGGGNDGNPDDPGNITTFSGQVILNDLVNSDIMVTANNEDGTVGPIEWKFLEGAGAYSLDVANNRSATVLIAYHDTDGNGLFEASDAIGEPTSNPFLLGIGDVPGVNIEIPSGTGTLPQPPVYVGVQGTVSMADFPGGTIRLFASAGSTQGMTFSSATLSSPGAFALSAPIDAGQVLVWAVLDEDSDGFWDANVDPFDGYGPFAVPASGIAGISLDLAGSLPSTIGGTVSYNGDVDAADILFVALFDNPATSGQPVYTLRYTEPEFPVDFVFEGVADGTWYPTALLDFGGDSDDGQEIGAEDISTVYPSGVTVSNGDVQSGINFSL